MFHIMKMKSYIMIEGTWFETMTKLEQQWNYTKLFTWKYKKSRPSNDKDLSFILVPPIQYWLICGVCPVTEMECVEVVGALVMGGSALLSRQSLSTIRLISPYNRQQHNTTIVPSHQHHKNYTNTWIYLNSSTCCSQTIIYLTLYTEQSSSIMADFYSVDLMLDIGPVLMAIWTVSVRLIGMHLFVLDKPQYFQEYFHKYDSKYFQND